MISVIIPVYNMEKYLRKCLDSVVNQTFKNIEIVIINDGSTDKSEKIIQEYKKKYKKIIKSFSKNNGGLSSARNYGISKALGEYILFVDSDDYIDKNMIEELYNKALKTNSDIVHCDIMRVSEDNQITGLQKMINGNPKTTKEFLLATPSACNKLIKKDILDKNRILFTEGVWFEDVAFSEKVISVANKNTYVTKPLYFYNQREGSIMHSPNLRKNLDLIKDFDDIIKFFKANKVFNEYKSEIEFFCIERMYITGVTRIIKIKGIHKEKKEIIEKYIEYVENNFPNYKRNKYIVSLDKKRKTIYTMINLRQFLLIKAILLIKAKISKIRGKYEL